MLPELAHYMLILALCLSIAQSTLPALGIRFNRMAWIEIARPAAYGQFLLIGSAFFSLGYLFLTNDFSVAYIAANSNTQLPPIYRFCAIWGAHEGSLLLWVFLLSIWVAAVSKWSVKKVPSDTMAYVLSVLGSISTGFLLFLLTTSNPFLRFLPDHPLDGRDLNPLLQDPGLVIHPPMLYMGYVGFSVVFAFAITALVQGRLDSSWARFSKSWTLIAWCFLTFGIILGSWWAYRELGWGGWWFWDPVENASFLPWLVGTALIHSLSVTLKRQAFKAWTILLAIFTFSLSLLGTFLVRSGVLISVHTFATDPLRGAFMLVFLAIVVGFSLALYAWRIQKIKTSAITFTLLSRESLLLFNNLLLTASMLTILLGTLYPLMLDTLGSEKISVGPPYFNIVFIPFMACVLFLMGIAPLSRWKDTSIKYIIRRTWLIFITTFGFAILFPWVLKKEVSIGVVLGVGLAFWIILVTLQSLFETGPFKLKKLSFKKWGMVVAHIGVAVCTLGIVLTSHYSEQKEVRLSPGEHVIVGKYQFTFLGTRQFKGENYTGVEGGVLVKSGNWTTFLTPQQRVYPIQKMALAKTAIDSGIFRDLYVALGEPLDEKSWSLRIYYKPFIRWIWGGGLLMILGGILALINKRKPKSPILEKF